MMGRLGAAVSRLRAVSSVSTLPMTSSISGIMALAFSISPVKSLPRMVSSGS
ncbi:MAG: hypothetical protein K2N13_08850 [Paraprevotella sp.]|nr:hypothetical protein [Paraprevotella sp.]